MREAEDDTVDALQRLGVPGDGGRVVAIAHVAPPLGLGHRRLEALAIEVRRHHLMAVRLQRLDDHAEQGVIVALGQRMGMDDLNAHGARTLRALP